MRGSLVPFVAVVLLLPAGCGGDGESVPPVADPTASPPTSTTTEPAAPETMPAPTVVTTEPAAPETTSPLTDVMPEPAATELKVLRPGGLGPVDFGTPAEDAIDELTVVLGAPDRVEPIGPGGECVEGARWLDCVRDLRLVESGQLAIWDDYGLKVALVDTSRDVWPKKQTALQFGDWHATVAPGDARLVTEEGLSAGMTVGELRATVPRVEFTYNEGLLDSFSIPSWTGGGYWGRLDWDPTTTEIDYVDIEAVQAALNEHGADLVVDGKWGPKTEAAWLAFLTDHDIEPFTSQLWLTPEIGGALGLPPDDITVATLEPRPALPPAITHVPLAILREDGLGRFDFGDPADELVDELIALLGEPADDTSYPT